MDCFNNSFGWCDVASYMTDSDGDLSYDESLMCDNEGCCMCQTDDDFNKCECFESDE